MNLMYGQDQRSGHSKTVVLDVEQHRDICFRRRKLARFVRANETRILRSWHESQFDPQRLDRFRVAEADRLTRHITEKQFIPSLFRLLVAYIETGEKRFRDVYLLERLRYAPHRQDPSVRQAFFSEVIPSDEAVILEMAGPELRQRLQHLLTDLHAMLLTAPVGEAVSLLAIGDCLMTELRAFLNGLCYTSGINLEMREYYFSANACKGISSQDVIQFLRSNRMDMIALSFLTYGALPLYPALLRDAERLTPTEIDARVTIIIKTMREFMSELREHTDATFLLHNASGLPLTRLRKDIPAFSPLSRGRQQVLDVLNHSIQALADHTSNVILIDERAIALKRGYRNAARSVIPDRIAKDGFFHTAYFGEYLAEPYSDILRSFRDLRKAKVLLLDFDDTLWKGVMADGDVTQYHDRQKLLQRLKDGGMLLVAVSKNDPSNIRWHEIVLRSSDFALLKINWNPKVQSIQEAADVLDLGLDSFVFIDDNPVERNLVQSQIPKVRALDAQDSHTWQSLERLLAFSNTRETEEARARTEMYRAQATRREVLAHTVDYAAMMASLQMKVRFGIVSTAEVSRLSELIQRTNQFNTTSIRYGKADIQHLLQSSCHTVYGAHVSDKFGSLGLCAAVIIEKRDGLVILDSFVMSCRAMGFGLEQAVLRLVMESEGRSCKFVGRFIATDRNSPAANFYSQAGFLQRNETEWTIEAEAAWPGIPPWFSVVDGHVGS